MASNRGPGRRWAIAVAVVALTVCGAGWAVSANGEAQHPGVSSQTATPATRDEMIRDWGKTLTEHGEQLPDTSKMSTAEIRTGWQRAIVQYAEPADMPTVYPCEGLKVLFDPDCW
ncbi:hypothetical protein [Streptomyces sp. NBC_00620]|uniref:hypothetical protein n=1 Tax=unclassified Streptomyces TaxID=2593676 RepID=UPI00224F1939|nr:hypothetical protein [Streptomyces sp. NBC_00620]MCX4974953.1 hypothetical protein [Streptomyces sp. NBC_00620]WUC10845.1 hypothetical protein OG256_13430 [Streptomyces sp. NBC_00564]WUC52631.1 hypothetical protein OG266_31520 [Streptomyces sp. NBC_00554]